MCGRFDLHSDAATILKEFGAESIPADYLPSYNIGPSGKIVIIKDDGKRHIVHGSWGFLPEWSKDTSMAMINARGETVAEKPAFKESFRKRRCLVIADGFFEWRREGKRKIPVYIRLKSRRPIGFAGIYSAWTTPDGSSICTCAIITTAANELLEPIHDRMPAIIPKDYEDIWLDPNMSDKERLLPLLRPYASEEMEMYEVSPLVNKTDYDSPDVIMPVNEE